MLKRINNKFAVIFTILLISSILFIGSSKVKNVFAVGRAYDNLKVFAEVLTLVESSYVEDVKSEDLIHGAIKGMLKTLDPHSTFLTPDMYKEVQVETEGEFGGLGIEITIKNEVLTIVAPIEDTPADRAGLKAGDKIFKIDGELTKDMTIMDAIKKMRGKEGTNVTLSVIRDNLEEPKDYVLTRAIIKIKSVKYNTIDETIGYIKIKSFTKTTADELDNALKSITKNKIDGMVLDLRNDPGGLLNQAVEVTDRFIEKGQLIVYTKGKIEEQNLKFSSTGKNAYLDFPIIVLVNAGSASASEIVAGALQDLKRGVVLGTQTFGKGSVQTIIPLSDGSGLRLTTAKYFTPKGRVIQGKGITPDIIVEEPIVVATKTTAGRPETGALREKDLKNHLKGEEGTPEGAAAKPVIVKGKTGEEDPQLERAVSLLKGWNLFQQIKGTTAK
jgi:carboxyl-terminal processing protease